MRRMAVDASPLDVAAAAAEQTFGTRAQRVSVQEAKDFVSRWLLAQV